MQDRIPGPPTPGLGLVFRGPSRRRAIFELGAAILPALFRAGRIAYEVIEHPIPDDAVVTGAEYDALRDVWRICVESPSFEEVPEMCIPPTLQPTVVISEGDRP